MSDHGNPMNTPPPLPGATPPPLPVRSRLRWAIHLLLIGSYPVLVSVIGGQRAPTVGPALGHDTAHLLLTSLENVGIFAVIFGLGWLASRATRDDLLWHWPGRWWTGPLSFAYSVGLRFAVGIIFVAVAAILVATRVFTVESLQQYVMANRPEVEAVVDISAMRSNPMYYLLCITLVSFVVAGLREELWRAGVLAGLRALWPRHFGSTTGQMLAVAIAAVFFGLGHWVQGPMAVAMTTVLGLGLGAIMVGHRSVWPAVLAHGFFDAASMALIPWATELLQRLQHMKPGAGF